MRKKGSTAEPRRYEEVAATPRIASPRGVAQTPIDKPLLTPAEVARILRVSRGLVYTLIQSGELPSVSIRRVRRIRARDLDRFIARGWKGKEDEDPPNADTNPKDPGSKVQGRLSKWRSSNEQPDHEP